MSNARTSIRIECSQETKELIEKWTELFGFSSMREALDHFMLVGIMCHEMVGGKPIDAQSFANALYSIGRRVVEAEFRDNVEQTVKEFQEWREKQELKVPSERFLHTKQLRNL